MAIEFNIISIGTMDSNLLWNEKGKVRTQHYTTTLVTEGNRTLLVDPSLPPRILEARLLERTGKGLNSITDVFCTTLHPSARRALEGLKNATWWCSEIELVDFGRHLTELCETADRLDPEDARNVETEQEIIRRFKPAPDKLSQQMGIFPLPGFSEGCAGLLLTPSTHTILIAGPAAPTQEHVRRGMIWGQCADKERAKESLVEILEIADMIVPGFDNVMLSPRHWM